MPLSPWSPLMVDAYAAQHPGGDSPQATQSVAAHLVALNAVLIDGRPVADAIAVRVAAVEAGRAAGGYPKLKPVPPEWDLTVADLVEAASSQRVPPLRDYVWEVRQRWADLHGRTIQEWFEAATRRLDKGERGL